MIKKYIVLALIFAGVLLVSPRLASAQANPELLREEFEKTYPLSPNGRISLENIQGTVRIQAWDRNEVKVHAVKSAYSRELLNDAEIKIEATGDNVRIRTQYPDGNLTFDDSLFRRYQNPANVDYTLSVPRNARLSSIELVNGGLEIEGVSGDVNASCVNGKITARLLKGEVKLGTVNGGLEATFDALNESKAISLGSVNGSVVVIIPSDSNAIIKVATVHGDIRNDFGLPVRKGDYVGRELYGQIGRGGARVKLGNVNGSINVRRASDGRTLSPATTLFSADFGTGKGKAKDKAKDKDGFDFEWNSDWDHDDSHSEQEARRAARDAQREAARAQKEAHRAQLEAERAQKEAQRAVAAAEREAGAESSTSTRTAQQEAVQVARETQQEAVEAAREAQQTAVEVAREAQVESSRAVRDAQREVVRVAREVARVAKTEAGRAVQIYSDGNYRLVERDTSRFNVGDSPRIAVETFDGAVAIHGWDKSEVVVNVVKRAANEKAMRGIRFSATKEGNQIKIVAHFDKAFEERIAQGVTSINANVGLEIFVPRKLILRASSGDGYLALDGINGEVELITEDGSIDVVDGRGRILAKTGDGRIRIVKFDGSADATTGEGRISLEGRFAQLTARTGDGSITLVIPADFNATIETDAERVVNESGLTISEEPSSSKRLRRFKIGKGGTVLSLRTGDGRIILRSAAEQ